MHQKPKILAFAGSLRKDSYNKKLIKIAVKAAEEAGADVTLIDLSDYPLPIYNADIETAEGLPENAKKLKKLMIESDGFMISTPEYNSSLPAVLKNVIDWASRQETKDEKNLVCFVGKTAALFSASPGYYGGLRSLSHLRAIMENIFTMVMPEQKAIAKAHEAFDVNGQLKDSKQQEGVREIAKKFVALLQAVKK